MTEEDRVRMATIVMVERYRAWMLDKQIKPVKSETGTGLPHVFWMLQVLRHELVDQYSSYDLWKASRWLGFIQHEIISAGWTTVTLERNYSRSFFKGEVTLVPGQQYNERYDGI